MEDLKNELQLDLTNSDAVEAFKTAAEAQSNGFAYIGESNGYAVYGNGQLQVAINKLESGDAS